MYLTRKYIEVFPATCSFLPSSSQSNSFPPWLRAAVFLFVAARVL